MKHTILSLALGAALILPGQLQAQANGPTDFETELRSMVVETTSEADRDRTRILDFLARDEVVELAAEHGLDLDSAKDRVRTLGADASADLAERVREAQEDAEQVGGDTIVITSTTVIIVLLVLILIAVA